jgi:hypothetical protein
MEFFSNINLFHFKKLNIFQITKNQEFCLIGPHFERPMKGHRCALQILYTAFCGADSWRCAPLLGVQAVSGQAL